MGVELGGVLEDCAGVEEDGVGGAGVEELEAAAVGEGGVGGAGVEEVEAAAVGEGGGVEETGVGDALDTLPPPSPSLYGGRRGKAAKENLGAPASQHAVPPDSSGRLESQQ